jgi:hypothetical protein
VASDLLLANLESPLWGWCNPDSVWLIDFWLELDTDLRAVLIAISPQRWLADQLSDPEAPSPDQILKDWYCVHQQILRQHLRHPQRTVVIDADEALTAPALVIEHLKQHWQLPLEGTDVSPVKQTEQQPLVWYFAEQICAQMPDIMSLQQELQASRARFSSSPSLQSVARVPIDDENLSNPVAIGLHALRIQLRSDANTREELFQRREQLKNAEANCAQLKLQCNNDSDEIKELRRQVSLLSGERDKLSGQLQEQRRVLEEVTEERDKQAKQLEEHGIRLAKFEEEVAQRDNRLVELTAKLGSLEKLEAQLKENQEENELLLRQLHQVQEELESVFLKGQDLEQNLAKLTREHEDDVKRLEDNEAQLTKRTRERDESLRRLEGKEAQLAKLRGEHDQKIAQIKQSESRVAKLTHECARQTKALEDRDTELASLNAALTQRQQQLKEATAHEKTIEQLRANLADTQEENELLLQQLHQVQEELESVFLKGQHLESQLSEFEEPTERWQRLVEADPHLFIPTSVEIKDASLPFASSALEWRFKDVKTAARDICELCVATFPDARGMAIAIKDDGEKSCLLRRPSQAMASPYCILVPTSLMGSSNAAAVGLRDLSTTDWVMLKGLIRIMLEKVAMTEIPFVSENAQAEQFLKDLIDFAQYLGKEAHALRYDTIELINTYTHPEYEHLWLRVNNLSFAGAQWPTFEFRFACAGNLADQFGEHPRIEFPADGGCAPFTQWFVESTNQFGDNLELRYGPPDKMDLGVWRKLSSSDQVFVSELLRLLPDLISSFSGRSRLTERGASAWVDLAKQVLETHNNLAGSTGRPRYETGGPDPSSGLTQQTAAHASSPASSTRLEAPNSHQERAVGFGTI